MGHIGPYGFSEISMVFIFHPVMSFILPLAVACLHCPPLRRLFPDLAWLTGKGKLSRLVQGYLVRKNMMRVRVGRPWLLGIFALSVFLLASVVRGSTAGQPGGNRGTKDERPNKQVAPGRDARPASPGEQNLVLKVGGLDRRYTVHVPTTWLNSGITLGKGTCLVVTGKAPNTPRTRDGERTMGSSRELRYWMMHWDIGRELPLYPQGSIIDEDVVLDAGRNYMIVIAAPEDRPANAEQQHGITWHPFFFGNRSALCWEIVSTAGPTWEHAPQMVGWDEGDYTQKTFDKEAVKKCMGEYYPNARCVKKADVEAMGKAGKPPYSVPKRPDFTYRPESAGSSGAKKDESAARSEKHRTPSSATTDEMPGIPTGEAIRIASGPITGEVKDGVRSFKGIPYAGSQGGRDGVGELPPGAVRASASVQPKTFLYPFARMTRPMANSDLRCFHGAEIPYVFGSLPREKGYADSDRQLSDLVMGCWVRFARTGDPNGDSAAAWPAYETSSDQHMILDLKPKVGSRLRQKTCDFFDAMQRR